MRTWRYAVSILIVAGLLSVGASVAIDQIGRRWFEHDVQQRAELVWRGVGSAIAGDVSRGRMGALSGILNEITRDEKVAASAVCLPNGKIVRSARYPVELSCDSLIEEADGPRTRRTSLGLMHVAVLPIDVPEGGGEARIARNGTRGWFILVHDLSFLEQRESAMRRVLIATILGLGALAFVITLAASRWNLRVFGRELRMLLRRGHAHAPEFQPLLKDVRALMQQQGEENVAGTGGEPWSSPKLKRVLNEVLQDDTIVVVANREPYVHNWTEDGAIKVLHPASGLVTALEPVMRACSGVWIAHGSGSADRITADKRSRLLVPPYDDVPENEKYRLRRLWLTPEQERGYYYGFSNEGLWPLCHIADTRPTFRRADWDQYKTVNERFADAVAQEVESDDPIVLVQDYHFALAPRFIRQRLPRATIITFWHIPWPNAERFGICPWTREILDGLLGSSILGFHTHYHCNNFIDAIDRFMEARVDREERAVVLGGRSTLVRPYPISIEWPNHFAERTPPAKECRAQVIAAHGLPQDALIGVGVDRIDYTKGIEERLLAVEKTLERFPEYLGRLFFLQLGAPSRSELDQYRTLGERIETIASRINSRFEAHGAYKPIVLLKAHHEAKDIYRYYRAADFCYVSSLHDGMNLVAKEFICARNDGKGVLLLSHFTGAARELTESLFVNPYDLENASDAMREALRMPEAEQKARMHSMRRWISEHNVYRWAARMLMDASRLRERERLHGRWFKEQRRKLEPKVRTDTNRREQSD
jgi:trehalose 6-phosphate synthase